MKILLFGKNGQVGWELQRSLAPLGEVIGLSSRSTELCGDLSDLSGIEQTVRSVSPDVIVNAAAYTAVDKAEEDYARARLFNAQAPARLAELSSQIDALLVHYSTDYVFDGSGNTAWKETDSTSPCNRYGETKAEGEQQIQATECRHLIFRTSWVYAARGNNFLKTMLRLASEREQLIVVADQHGVPTGADLIADVTAHTIRSSLNDVSLSGLYHLAPTGTTSWHQFACSVVSEAIRSGVPVKASPEAIQAVPTTEYPTPAPRPLNSRLDTSKLRNRFQLALPDWLEPVRRTVAEIIEK